MSETKQIKMVHTETQTDTMDISGDCSPCALLDNREISLSLNNLPSPDDSMQMHDNATENTLRPIQLSSATSLSNGNISMASSDTVDHNNICSKSNEQLIYDYMNSNEQLDIRESSDEDNLEKLDRRVSQFFNENRLMHADNGNGSTVIDSRALFNVMAARRSCISINDKDEVTIVSRANNYNYISGKISGNKISDHNCNNDDGDDEDDCDDSWTDEEGEDSIQNYSSSLRRKR